MNSSTVEERLAKIEERIEAARKVEELRANEYARRLKDLNHDHERRAVAMATFVTIDKFEDNLKAESRDRVFALTRLDERFAEHVKQFEHRQRQLEDALLLQREVASSAREDASLAARHTNKNLQVMTVALAVVVVAMNLLTILI